MEKGIVIYNSQTGFTKKYAQWIGEGSGFSCVELAKAKGMDLSGYGTIIFGSWACAGSVSKLKWFKGKMREWSGKSLAVFCTGASPILTPQVKGSIEKCFGAEREKVKIFYCPAGLDYDKMPAVSKAMMKTLLRVLNGKKKKTEDDKAMIDMISKSYDITDRKHVEPIVAWAKQATE